MDPYTITDRSETRDITEEVKKLLDVATNKEQKEMLLQFSNQIMQYLLSKSRGISDQDRQQAAQIYQSTLQYYVRKEEEDDTFDLSGLGRLLKPEEADDRDAVERALDATSHYLEQNADRSREAVERSEADMEALLTQIAETIRSDSFSPEMQARMNTLLNYVRGLEA